MTSKYCLERIFERLYLILPENIREDLFKPIKQDLDKLEKLEEKEIPIKPIANHYEEVREKPYIKYSCPKCNSKHQLMKNYGEYCPHCGQRLDWSECNE